MVKGPAQQKFGPAYWHHFFIVAKNVIKVYKEVIDRHYVHSKTQSIRFLQIYLCLLRICFFWYFSEKVRSFLLLH